MEIQGIIPAATAVFSDGGALDIAGYRQCCEKLCEAGAGALALFALEAEPFQLSSGEELLELETTARLCRERGVGLVAYNHRRVTSDAIAWGRRMEQAGVDGMVLDLPESAGGDMELASHVRAVAQSLSLPVLVNWVIGDTCLSMDAAVGLARELVSLRGFMVSGRGGDAVVNQLLQALPHDRQVFLGSPSGDSLPGFHRGCAGVVVSAGVADAHRKVWECLLQGDYLTAQQTYDRLALLRHLVGEEPVRLMHGNQLALLERGFIATAGGRCPDRVFDPVTDLLFRQYLGALEGDFSL